MVLSAIGLLLLSASPAALPSPVRVEELVRETADGPVRGWVARVDLTDPRVSFVATAPAERRADDPPGTEAHLVPTDAWAEREGVDLAVNGGFFARLDAAPETAAGWTDGQPVDIVGLTRSDGRTVCARFGAPGKRSPRCSSTRRTGAPARAPCGRRSPRSATSTGSRTQWRGWGPAIGQPGTLLVESGENRGATAQVAPAARHPRTAAGVTRDGRTLLLVVVDGRQPGWSIGATLPGSPS